MTIFSKVKKAIAIIVGRLRNQGLRTTLLWVYARGLPRLTGIPLLRYSRVTPQLFVGPQYGRAGKRWLERNRIQHGVNLRIEFDDAAHGLALAGYCYLPTVDDDPISLEHLAEGASFILEALRSGGKVYVHCAGGIGRAPSLAAAYLITQGYSLTKPWTSSGAFGRSSTQRRPNWNVWESSRPYSLDLLQPPPNPQP